MTTTHDATGDAGRASNPPQRSDALQKYDVFVADVTAACREPGVQQALRRALAKPVDEVPARAHRALLRPGLIPYDVKDKRPHYAVAALIADRPRAQRDGEDTEPSLDEPAPGTAGAELGTSTAPAAATNGFRPGGTNLGESIALAVTRRNDSIKEEGAESRLHLMVRQDIDELHRMLPSVVRRVSGTGVRIDYACLLRDLRSWPRYRDEITTRWLESFYRTLRTERAKAADNTDA